MSAQKCPVCNGSGFVCVNPNQVSDRPEQKICHGCDGKGWVNCK
jgi:DnaJ-class molecular chaperone